MAYAAATKSILGKHQENPVLVSLPIADNVKIVKGAVVIIDSNGYANNPSDATGQIFAGIADEEVDNTITGHSAGGLNIKVRIKGVWRLKNGGNITAAKRLQKADLALDTNNITVDLDGNGGGSTAYLEVGIIVAADTDFVDVLIDNAIGNVSTAVG